MRIEIKGGVGESVWVAHLKSMFAAAIQAAMPANCLPPHLPGPPTGEGATIIVGAGKAADEMAACVEQYWQGSTRACGAVAVPEPVEKPAGAAPIVRISATHPVPGAGSEQAARHCLELASQAGAGDLVLCLLSGGASSLWALPVADLAMADKIAVTKALLKSGATIQEMNIVRKHLSRIKGGRLAKAAAPARLVTLAISDVPGDAPDAIGSGPSVGDPTTLADARAVLDRYAIDVSVAVRAALEDRANETVKPDDPCLAGNRFTIIADADMALDAAAEIAGGLGLAVLNLGGAVAGEARAVARDHARLVAEIRTGNGPVSPPCVILSGGETSVTIRGGGQGGRNSEYLLALYAALETSADIYAIACDTDGIDGVSNFAGAIMDPGITVAARHVDHQKLLDDNDSLGFFAAVGGLVKTGPTGTNVNDFRAILVI